MTVLRGMAIQIIQKLTPGQNWKVNVYLDTLEGELNKKIDLDTDHKRNEGYGMMNIKLGIDINPDWHYSNINANQLINSSLALPSGRGGGSFFKLLLVLYPVVHICAQWINQFWHYFQVSLYYQNCTCVFVFSAESVAENTVISRFLRSARTHPLHTHVLV